MRNALFYGDNLAVLRERVADESVDLVYLDPPFNSNASYNVLFRERTGEESPAQIRAFTDTWEWTQETELTFERDIIGNPAVPPAVKDMITAFRQFIGRNAMMAYLVMMAPRLVELRRVLKPTGSIYLHCGPHGEPLPETADGRGVCFYKLQKRIDLEKNERPQRCIPGRATHGKNPRHYLKVLKKLLPYLEYRVRTV